jgi:hypothetical protein
VPAIVSAEPDQIFRFVAAADDLDASLKAEVPALAAALDHVQRTCADYLGPFPRLDRDLAGLLRAADQVVKRFLEVAIRFLMADRANIWVSPGRRTPQSFDAFWAQVGPDAPPPLAALLLVAGGPTLDNDDLHEIGHALLSFGSTAKSAVDAFGRLVTTPLSLLSSPQGDWVTDQLAHAAGARRVIGGLARFSTTPLAGAGQAALTTLTVLEDANRLKRDGNPLNAWRHKGLGYLADLSGAGFDVTSTACANEPSWPTCGAAAVTGAAWTAAQSWQHREDIVRGVDLISQEVTAEARRIRGLASRALQEVGPTQNGLIEDIRNADRNPGLVRFPPVVTHAIADTVERAGHVAGTAVHGSKELLSSGWRAITH